MKKVRTLDLFQAYMRHRSGDYSDGLGDTIFTQAEITGLIGCFVFYNSRNSLFLNWEAAIDGAVEFQIELLEHNTAVKECQREDRV